MTTPSLVSKIAPPYTTQRLALALAKSAARRPSRIRQRINRGNLQLHRAFASWSFTCNVCGGTGPAFFDMPDVALRREHHIGLLRETLQCRHCGCTMRDRSLTRALLAHLGAAAPAGDAVATLPAELRILDTDNHSALSRVMAHHPGQIRSMFVPDRPNGAELDGPRVLNVNLEDMPFKDATFDVVLTSDVLEHVRDFRAAHAEIARCLRPGGAYIFNVPYNEDLARHRTLIDTSTDVDIPLEELHIHGESGEGGIKAYRIYGRQIFDDLAEVGLTARLDLIDDAGAALFEADVFTAIKSG
jgi:SAM-dependent methyltransferase